MTTFGDLDDFKHFLPRLIELHIQAPFETPYGAYILFDKLAYARWLNWPENERSAVTAIIQDWAENLRASGTEDDSYVLKEVADGMRSCGMVRPDCCGAETVAARDAAIG